MINQGTYKDVTWEDDWTAVTADGQRSAQFEHTLLITMNYIHKVIPKVWRQTKNDPYSYSNRGFINRFITPTFYMVLKKKVKS